MTNQKEIVLYVDDEQANLDGFRLSLRNHYEIYTALSAQEGLQIIQSKPVKVLITDQRMPVQTGTELLKQVMEEFPDIVRIILTGYMDLSATIEAINQGKVFHYITKPWNKEDIILIINRALEHYNLKKQNKELLINLKLKNAQLEDARKEAVTSENLIKSFLSNISHELRTPLNGIIGFTNLLVSRYEKNEYTTNIFNLINTSSNDLLRIMTDLLDISRLESGDIKTRKQEFQLTTFLNELFEMYNTHELLNGKNIVFELNTTINESVNLFTDPQRLRQIIANYLLNAFKYTNEGKVTLGAQQNANALQIYVKDTGVGISDKHVKEIFNPFYKIEQLESLQRGNGLGLSISFKIAKILGFNLSVDTKEKEGSTFFIHIPC